MPIDNPKSSKFGPVYHDPTGTVGPIWLPPEGSTLYRSAGKQMWGRPLIWKDTVIMAMGRNAFNHFVMDILEGSALKGARIEELQGALIRIAKRFEPLPGANIVGIPLESVIELASKIEDVVAVDLVNQIKKMDPINVTERVKDWASRGGSSVRPIGYLDERWGNLQKLAETLDNITDKPHAKQVMHPGIAPEVWTVEPVAATQQIQGPITPETTERAMMNPDAGEYWGRLERQPSEIVRMSERSDITPERYAELTSPEYTERLAREPAKAYLDLPGHHYGEEGYPGRQKARSPKLAREFIDWAADLMNKVRNPMELEQIMEAQLVQAATEQLGAPVKGFQHRGDAVLLKPLLDRARKLNIKFPKGLVGLAPFLLGAYAASQDEEEAGALAMAGSGIPVTGLKVYRGTSPGKTDSRIINPKNPFTFVDGPKALLAKLVSEGEIPVPPKKLSSLVDAERDAILGKYYKDRGHDFIIYQRKHKQSTTTPNIDFTEVADLENKTFWTPNKDLANLYGLQDRERQGIGRIDPPLEPLPPFKSSPTGPEIVSATDPVMGEHYAERQLPHIEGLERQPYVDITEGKPLTKYGGTVNRLIRGERGAVFIDVMPKKKDFKLGIAIVLYDGDISQVTKSDIKHFGKKWKIFSQYPLEQLQEASGRFTIEELKDPAERQLIQELKVILSINEASKKSAIAGKKAAAKVAITAEQRALEQYIEGFRTEKVRIEASLRELQDDIKFAETPLKRGQLDQAIVVAKKRIKDLDQNIASAAKRFKKMGGFVEAPDAKGLRERFYRKTQQEFVPEAPGEISKRFAKPTAKSFAKGVAMAAPLAALDFMDLYGIITEPSDARMYEDIGSMIVGKEPGERKRLPITKEEIRAFEDVAGKFQTMPTEEESLMEMFMPGSMAEGQVYTETGEKIQVNQELAKKYMDYVLSRDRLDRETGEWVAGKAGEFQDPIERRTFEEAAKNYAAWKKDPQGPSPEDMQRAEELAFETAQKQEVMPSKTALPQGTWGEVLMGVEEPQKEKKTMEPGVPRIPQISPMRKGDRPSKETVPPRKRPSPYKKNIPLRRVDPKEEAAKKMIVDPTIEEPTFEFFPTTIPGSTTIRGLSPGMPIIGEVK